MAKIILIRHGELPETCRGRYVGVSDPPLSPEGEAECRALRDAPELAGHGRIFVSPRRRTLQSAVLIFGGDAEITVDARLREMDFGDWEMLDYAQIAAQADPALLKLWSEAPEKMVFPHGESLPEVAARVEGFLRELARSAPFDAPPVLVTHGGVLNYLLCKWNCLPLARQAEIRMPRGTLRMVEVPQWEN